MPGVLRTLCSSLAVGALALLGACAGPSTKSLCRALQGGPSCEHELRRLDAGDGATLAYLTCDQGSCPVVLVRGRQLDAMRLPGLRELRLATVDGQQVALATEQVEHAPGWTSTTVEILRIPTSDKGKLSRALRIVTEESDTRGGTSNHRRGQLTVEEGQLRFRGERTINFIPSGKLISSVPLDEKYHLAPAK